ncbi:MAG: hypothetical protein H0V39_01045 [Nitrosomonas sp.]|nr:hypothetical protein [Nitrosomonas sp.]
MPTGEDTTAIEDDNITYVRTHLGWSYLACVFDLASIEIVGWAFSQQPIAELAETCSSTCH